MMMGRSISELENVRVIFMAASREESVNRGRASRCSMLAGSYQGLEYLVSLNE